jgi:imidazolonepropionase-like amidohydrolase
MNTWNRSLQLMLPGLALGAWLGFEVRADGPHVYAITGARIVTAAGEPVPSGTVMIRGGFIDAVGASVAVPEGAQVIEAKGCTVYPGLIDMGNSTGLAAPPAPAEPRNAQTRLEVERWKRETLLRPHVEAASLVQADSADLKRLASAGITSILAVPAGYAVRGHSALINVAAHEDQPQIGNIADHRRGLYVLRTPVALHISFPGRIPGDAYPVSLMGLMGFVRQAFSDAQHYQGAAAHYEKMKSGPRPVHDSALEALQPAIAGREPVVFEANSCREIIRMLSFAREFDLDPIVLGGLEADQVAGDLKFHKARVLFSLNYPVRSRLLAPEADEPLSTLRQRARAPSVPAALSREGVMFAFTSGGLRDPKDFIRNAAKAVQAGLQAEAALKALTLDAAVIAGVGAQLGSLEKGKIANLIVADGDLFDEKTSIRHVFVDGRPVQLDSPAAPPSRTRPGTQASLHTERHE